MSEHGDQDSSRGGVGVTKQEEEIAKGSSEMKEAKATINRDKEISKDSSDKDRPRGFLAVERRLKLDCSNNHIPYLPPLKCETVMQTRRRRGKLHAELRLKKMCGANGVPYVPPGTHELPTDADKRKRKLQKEVNSARHAAAAKRAREKAQGQNSRGTYPAADGRGKTGTGTTRQRSP